MIGPHFKIYAKAYSGAGTSLVAQPLSDHVANAAMWGISLLGVVPPESVAVSLRYIFVAIATGIVTMIVGNTARESE